VKGKANPILVFEPSRSKRAPSSFHPLFINAIIGRDKELKLLRKLFLHTG